MKDVIEDVDRWIERGDKVALATVVGVRRSAPRPPGAKMAINDKGEISGMVSGGCVEGAVIEIADRIISGDVTISMSGSQVNISAVANVSGKAASMGEGTVQAVLTQLVKAFAGNLAKA